MTAMNLRLLTPYKNGLNYCVFELSNTKLMVTYDCINLQLKNKNMVAKQLLPESLQNIGKDHFCIEKNELIELH